jgi:hypothetical protein
MFWLHYPVSLMPVHVANMVYYGASFGLVILLALSALAICRLPLSLCNVLGLATLILASRPGHINLLLGQVTLPMVLGAVWALQLARRWPAVAGIALAVTTLKPTFGVPLLWLMFCRRDYRAVAVGVVVAGVAATVGLVPLVADHGWASVLESLRQSNSLHESDPVVTPMTTWTRVDAISLVGKALDHEPSAAASLAVTAGCLLLAGWAVWRTSGTPLAEGADSLSALVIAAATLACIYHSTYDALLFVVPWIGVMFAELRQQLPGRLHWLFWILLTLPAINYFSARVVTRLLSIDGALFTVLTMLNSICVVAILVLAIGVALRRTLPASSALPIVATSS